MYYEEPMGFSEWTNFDAAETSEIGRMIHRRVAWRRIRNRWGISNDTLESIQLRGSSRDVITYGLEIEQPMELMTVSMRAYTREHYHGHQDGSGPWEFDIGPFLYPEEGVIEFFDIVQQNQSAWRWLASATRSAWARAGCGSHIHFKPNWPIIERYYHDTVPDKETAYALLHNTLVSIVPVLLPFLTANHTLHLRDGVFYRNYDHLDVVCDKILTMNSTYHDVDISAYEAALWNRVTEQGVEGWTYYSPHSRTHRTMLHEVGRHPYAIVAYNTKHYYDKGVTIEVRVNDASPMQTYPFIYFVRRIMRLVYKRGWSVKIKEPTPRNIWRRLFSLMIADNIEYYMEKYPHRWYEYGLHGKYHREQMYVTNTSRLLELMKKVGPIKFARNRGIPLLNKYEYNSLYDVFKDLVWSYITYEDKPLDRMASFIYKGLNPMFYSDEIWLFAEKNFEFSYISEYGRRTRKFPLVEKKIKRLVFFDFVPMWDYGKPSSVGRIPSGGGW